MEQLLQIKDLSSDEDFYKLLGCDETSTVEQISTEFRLLARKYHPDKASSPEDRAAAEKFFIKLDRARQFLTDKEKRSKYDLWRTGGFKNVVSFEKWFEMQSRVHASMHWVAPKTSPALQEADSTPVDSQSSRLPPGANAQAHLMPTSLEEFRRGGDRVGSDLSNFRNYNL